MNKIKLSILAVSLNLIIIGAQAVEFGTIVEFSGEGFISHDGKTKAMKKGDKIEMDSDIVIEHKGQVTITDNADHRYHLANLASVNVKAQCLELRSGDLWVQSLNKNDTHKIQTANALIKYEGGEAIISYSAINDKKEKIGITHLMVINGMMNLVNLGAPKLNLNIAEGNYSFVNNNYDQGAPRNPTPVGKKTYNQLIGLFKGIKPIEKNSPTIFKNEAVSEEHKKESSRTVASVSGPTSEKSNIIDPKLMDDYKESVLAKSESQKIVSSKKYKSTLLSKKKARVTQLEVVHIYGATSVAKVSFDQEALPLSKNRAPASVLDNNGPAASVETTMPNLYSKDVKNLDKESNQLIDDLKKLQ